MNTGPLNENELEWLDDTLAKYAAEGAILDVSELDGLLTAILSAPTSNPLSGCWRFGAGRIMSRAGPTIASAIALSI
jgi:hypothetical protein